MPFIRRSRAWIRLLRTRWRVLSVEFLRMFQRFVPSDRQRVFILTAIVGAICGLVAVAFHLAIRFVEHLLFENAISTSGYSWIVWLLLVPTVGGLIAGILLQYVVPDARGSGIPQVKVAYVAKGGRIPFRVVIGKFVIGVIQIGSGSSLGREGPTVQMCAGIASQLGRAAALTRRSLRGLLPVGAAAGVAAAFNAPIAAVTFAIEEIVGDLDGTILSGVVVAAAIAAVIERSVLGGHPVLNVSHTYHLHDAASLLLYGFLGVAAAGASILFSDSLLKLRAWFQKMTVLPAWSRPAVGGLVTGALAVVALLWMNVSGIMGGGYETLSMALEGLLTLDVLLPLCLMKMAATVFSYSSGGSGGIFAPSLFIGGMLGGAVGYLDVALFNHSASDIGAFALVGMGAAFAGIIRAPMTSVMIIFEMTGGYSLILPLMIANITAFALARRWRPTPVYEALLEQDGIHLPHSGSVAGHALEQMKVSDAMKSDLIIIPGDATIEEAIEMISPYTYSSFPVLDDKERFIGLISEARLRRTMAEGEGNRMVQYVANRRNSVFPDQPVLTAVVLMDKAHTAQLAVVDRADHNHLIGMLTMTDVVRAQARIAVATNGEGESGAAPFSEVEETLDQ